MFLLRRSVTGLTTQIRTLGVWPFLLLAVWALVAKLQEPDLFIRQDVSFYWPSLGSMIVVLIGLAPLASRLSQGREAATWSLQASRSPARQVIASFLSHLGYGALLLLAGIALSLTVERIDGVAFRFDAALGCLLFGLTYAAITASLAPALAMLPGPVSLVVFCWLLVQAACLQFFGPQVATLTFWAIVSAATATLGGLTLSLAHTIHRLQD